MQNGFRQDGDLIDQGAMVPNWAMDHHLMDHQSHLASTYLPYLGGFCTNRIMTVYLRHCQHRI